MHVAARQGHSSVVQWLVDPKTGLTDEMLQAKNDAGTDAFTLACVKGHLRVVEMLVGRLGKSSFTPSAIQRAHDLHQSASTQEKYNLNRALVKFLREWMQEMQYGDVSQEEEETVEVVTMRDLIAKSDLTRPTGNAASQSTTDSSTLLGSSSSSAAIPEAETEEDESESEEDEDEDDLDKDDRRSSVSKALSSPPALDNAHLQRSALINETTTVADGTSIPAQ